MLSLAPHVTMKIFSPTSMTIFVQKAPTDKAGGICDSGEENCGEDEEFEENTAEMEVGESSSDDSGEILDNARKTYYYGKNRKKPAQSSSGSESHLIIKYYQSLTRTIWKSSNQEPKNSNGGSMISS
ncbi:hypothetical protein QE152_g35939 [Popillia japonica]|uniref:Uncharacterized protein n=1 Tax=Popillia japonica TaxID=7064 RepID=A0AAW1IEM3_POPJA